MAERKEPDQPKKKKNVVEYQPTFMQNPELDPELIPQDARKYMLAAFDILIDTANNTPDPHAKFAAVGGIDKLYTTLVMATRTDELLTKQDHHNKNLLGEVKKHRHKPNAWDEEQQEEE